MTDVGTKTCSSRVTALDSDPKVPIIFAVAATTRDQARRAAKLAVVEYEELPSVFDPLEAMTAEAPTGGRVQ